ncbi:PREDICTED: uncharacterized protein LOC104798820 [Tarenaya hassleriana]|uniref:uncharacterized protein LOC104798820 n=1 Tax=Tarenaya hassleriana TaxID=28532 RepID=UPI00053C74A9|nr:PREDICTED: uncharacterized protein LOC104798820 [Tarenaya hassleriana]
MAANTSSSTSALPVDTVTPYSTDSPLININVSNVTKLTATNYLTWSIQIRTLLQGYNLDLFLDPAQDPSLTVTAGTTVAPNPNFQQWFRQDRLVFSALLGSISGTCQALVASAATSAAAWTTLAQTYGRSSQGHVKLIKDHIRRYTKGTKTLDEYMNFFKAKGDELTLLGKTMDHEDLVDLILAGLGDEYKPIKDIVQAWDTIISFVELHEKLFSHDIDLTVTAPLLATPVLAHVAQQGYRPSWRPPAQNGPRQFPGPKSPRP